MRRSAVVALLMVTSLSAACAIAQQVTIIGLVSDASGPLADAIVEAYREGSFVGFAKTLPNGYFSLQLPGIGIYELVIYKRGYERKSFSIQLLTAGTVNLGQVELGHALTIGLEATHIVVDQGSTIELPLTITNVGAFTELIDIVVKAPAEWSASIISQQNLIVKSLVLNPGDTKAFRIRIRAPGSAEGSAKIDLIFNYANFTHKVPLTVEAAYKNWELIAPYYPEVSSFAGGTLLIPVRIRNTLQQPCVINVSVVPPEGWTAVLLLNSTQVSSLRLDPGESLLAQLSVAVPEGTETGNFVITLRAVALDVVSLSTVLVRVEASYDRLRVETSSPFVIARPGDSVAFPLKIANDGTRASIARFAVEGLPAGYSWSARDANGNTISAIIIPPRASQTISLVVSIPSAASPTAFSFVFEATGQNSSSRIKLGVNIAGKPSINILTQNWSVELTSGSSSVYQLLIENNGQIPLQEIKIELGGGLPAGLRVDIEPARVVNLQPGGTAVFMLTIVASSELEPGVYFVPLAISSEGARVERMLAVSVRAGGGFFYAAISLVTLLLVLSAYLLTTRRLRGSSA